MDTEATVDLLALRLMIAGLALVVTVTVLFEVTFFLFLLGFGATPFPRNFPLAPLTQAAGLAKVLRRYLRLKMPHSFWSLSATMLACASQPYLMAYLSQDHSARRAVATHLSNSFLMVCFAWAQWAGAEAVTVTVGAWTV